MSYWNPCPPSPPFSPYAPFTSPSHGLTPYTPPPPHTPLGLRRYHPPWGNPDHIAPELLREVEAARIEHRDAHLNFSHQPVYELGVLAFEVLAEDVPTAAHVLDQEWSHVPPLHEYYPKDLRDLCARMVSRNPADRPDMVDVVATLQLLLAATRPGPPRPAVQVRTSGAGDERQCRTGAPSPVMRDCTHRQQCGMSSDATAPGDKWVVDDHGAISAVCHNVCVSHFGGYGSAPVPWIIPPPPPAAPVLPHYLFFVMICWGIIMTLDAICFV